MKNFEISIHFRLILYTTHSFLDLYSLYFISVCIFFVIALLLWENISFNLFWFFKKRLDRSKFLFQISVADLFNQKIDANDRSVHSDVEFEIRRNKWLNRSDKGFIFFCSYIRCWYWCFSQIDEPYWYFIWLIIGKERRRLILIVFILIFRSLFYFIFLCCWNV